MGEIAVSYYETNLDLVGIAEASTNMCAVITYTCT